MNEMESLKQKIEEARKDLDASIFKDKFEVYYEKSKRLDELIEKYIAYGENSSES